MFLLTAGRLERCSCLACVFGVEVGLQFEVPDSGVDFFYVSAQEAYLLMKNDKDCGSS